MKLNTSIRSIPTRSKLPAVPRTGGKNMQLIQDFIASRSPCAKVELAKNENAWNKYIALRQSATKHGYAVRVKMVNGEVYMEQTITYKPINSSEIVVF